MGAAVKTVDTKSINTKTAAKAWSDPKAMQAARAAQIEIAHLVVRQNSLINNGDRVWQRNVVILIRLNTPLGEQGGRGPL